MADVLPCYKCKTEKPISEFSRDKKHKTGFQTTCKACNREYQRAWYEANRERHLAQGKISVANRREQRREYEKAWYLANRDRYLSVCKDYRNNNKDMVLEKARSKYEADPSKRLEYSRKREISLMQRTPAWYSEFDRLVFEEAYSLAKLREASTDIEWHVDHMLPLRSKKVSGLHLGINAQVIPAAMNLNKGNQLLYTNPGEWVKSL